MKGYMQRIYFEDMLKDHLGDQLKEIFVEGLYVPYFRGRENLTVLDVGANLGMFSYFAKPYSKIIYALEPSTVQFDTLSLMLKDNEITNVVPVKLGLSNKSGEQTFYVNNANNTANMLSTYIKPAPTTQEAKIQTVTIEDFMQKYELSNIDILKLDVEGEESKILSHSSFERVCPRIKTILLEYHDWCGVTADQLKWMLLDRGYKVEQLNTQATVLVGTRQ